MKNYQKTSIYVFFLREKIKNLFRNFKRETSIYSFISIPFVVVVVDLDVVLVSLPSPLLINGKINVLG